MRRIQICVVALIQFLLLGIYTPGFGQTSVRLNLNSHQNNFRVVPVSAGKASSQALIGSSITLHLRFRLPLLLPQDDFEFNDNAAVLGASLLYGRNLTLGIGFDYGRFSEQEQGITDESGPEIIGTFQPKSRASFTSWP